MAVVHDRPLPAYLQSLLDYLDKPTRLVVGLNSGSSADGPTAVVARVTGSGAETRVEVVAWENYEYESPLRERIFDTFARDTATVDRVAQAHMAVGEFFADVAGRVVRKARLRFEDIDLIVSASQFGYQVIDGQRPEHRWLGDRSFTSLVESGSASVIAERTGVNTISRIRQRDIAAGGLGVPAVTYGDWVLHRHPTHGRIIQNIGGIANPIVLPAGASIDDVFAFDCGPGNMIIDALVGWMTDGRQAYDRAGDIAASGTVHQGLLAELMEHPFIRQAPPKGAARQLFGHQYSQQVRERGRALGMSDDDIVATATALTAEAMAYNYKMFIFPRARVDEVYAAGGGAHNITLLRMLRERLGSISVEPLSALGWEVELREVLAMVVIANDTVHGKPGNAPGATGASRRVVCGDITPGRPG